MNFPRTGELLPCRQPVVETLQRALRRDDRQGALVLGETGMGKSMIVRALQQSAPDGGPRHVVRASRALRTVPYGALSEVLAGVSTRDLGSPVSMLRIARQRMGRPEGRGVPRILVDDAQFLDDESTHLLTQLVVMGAIRMVAFADYSVADSSGLSGFANEGYLDRVHLEPLTGADLRTEAESALGMGALGQQAILHLERATGGNPMLLKALLEHAGVRFAADGPDWDTVLTGPPTDALRDVVASIVTPVPVPAPQRKALDLLALGGSVATTHVERLAGGDAVRSLVARRLAVVHPAASGSLMLRHGLVADVIRATLPLGRKALLWDQLQDAAPVLPPYDRHRIRHLEWAVDTGSPVAPAVLLDAARVATHVGRFEVADRFIHTASAREPAHAARERARLLAAGGRAAEAVQLLADVSAGAGDGARSQAVALRWTAMRQGGATPAELHALLDSCTVPEGSDGTGAAVDDGEAAGRLRLLRARTLLDEGEVTAVDTLTEAPVAGPEDVLGLALRGAALGMQGRAVKAEECTRAAVEAVTADPYALVDVVEDVVTHHILVLAHAGRAADALRGIEQAGAMIPAGLASALRGIVLTRQGDFRSGLGTLMAALPGLRRTDRQLLLPYSLGIAAWGAAVLGDVDQARALVHEARMLPRRGRLDLELLGRAFAAAAASLLPHSARSPVSLAGYLDAVSPPGLRACEKDILVLGLLLGLHEGVDRLARLTMEMEGEEALVLGRFAGAASSRDAAELIGVADHAAASGLPLLAVSAAARARALQGESTAFTEARAASRRLGRYGASFVGTHFEVPVGVRRVSDLAKSEQVVAHLAAAGHSNRGIAEALSLSIRTVEGHLHRTYVKLGIAGRADLAREFQEQGGGPLVGT
ncbi:LuxR C-terminal-related transcriptional regulator [Arthrobacter sp. L77]|uniref:LuxR C-terminal-related transcriptional regulator n=1 Tax=Arthrobacter sp. L77 TaxID=1496689 RepID=UPI0005B81EA6|nr:LuxR C-terminal-related transcriptional regulator [Arthrobacter sp. L77]